MHNLQTILDWIRYSCSLFNKSDLYYGHGTESAFDEAVALVLGILKLPYNYDLPYWQAKLTATEINDLQEALRARVEHRIPVPYLTKRTLYGDLDFYVDERALIPRSPIAEFLKNNAPNLFPENIKILDLCCGGGCLGIVAKYNLPAAEVILADISPEALQVAQINIDKFNLNDEVSALESDLFSNIEDKFDLIICNPPYVEEIEMEEIAQEYLHEPRSALTSGEDGLDLTREILRQASAYLHDDGYLLLEVGMSWHNLEEAFPDCDFNWLDFENGGEGVCLISADELAAWQLAGLLD